MYENPYPRVNQSSPELDAFDQLRQESREELKAFASHYDRCAVILYSLALRILDNTREAEEVLQEVLLQSWETRGKLSAPSGRLLSALVSQVRNRSIDRLRSRKRYRELGRDPFASGEESGTTESCLYDQQCREVIRSSFQSLTAEQRKTIELAYFSGLTRTEIAGVLQNSPEAVQSRIHEGLKKMRMARDLSESFAKASSEVAVSEGEQ